MKKRERMSDYDLNWTIALALLFLAIVFLS